MIKVEKKSNRIARDSPNGVSSFQPGKTKKEGNERAIFRRRLLKLYSNVTLERNLFTFFSSLNYQYFFLFLKLFSQTNAFSGTKSSHKHSI